MLLCVVLIKFTFIFLGYNFFFSVIMLSARFTSIDFSCKDGAFLSDNLYYNCLI